jgi:low affinity Fe/Cu permease
MARTKNSDVFNRFTSAVSQVLGRAWIFVIALVVLLLWGASGPLLGFSDTWQLIINTSTTIITFLMVFIIQNTQNRDNMAMNIKLDAIMKRVGVTNKNYMDAEDESDKQLEKDKKVVQRTKPKPRRK